MSRVLARPSRLASILVLFLGSAVSAAVREPQGGDASVAQDSSIDGPQDDDHVRAVLEGTQRWRVYLERRPTHEGVFADLVAAGSELGGMDVLVAHYRARHAAEPEKPQLAILLARLLEWRGDVAEARELLGQVPELDAEGLTLAAGLASQAGEVEEACALLERALASTVDHDVTERLLLALCDARRRAGDYAGVRETLARLGDTAPDDGLLQREVAWRLVEAGDAAAARQRLLHALELATDPVHRVATLDELARLEEREQLGAEALEHLEELLTRLAAGHWMRADVQGRLVDLHRFGGTLEPWVEARRARLADDPDGRLALDVARGLQALGRDEPALEVLRTACDAHPGDEVLERALLGAARDAGDPELRIGLLQERIARHPSERDLGLELVRELAAAGRAEAARRQLARLVEEARDPVELQRLAGTLDDPQLAAELLAALARRTPEDPSPWVDLARLHGRATLEAVARRRTEREAGRPEAAGGIEVPPLPEATLDALAEVERRIEALGDPHARVEARLEQARLRADLGRTAEAVAQLEVLAADGDLEPTQREATLWALAEGRQELEDVAGLRAVLWELARLGQGANRARAVERWAQTFADESQVHGALAALDDAPDDPDLVDRARARLGAVHGLDGVALEALGRLLARDPGDLAAREERARALLRAERVLEALAEQRELVVRDPARRAVHLLDVARTCRRLGRHAEALAAADGARRATWDSAGLLREVARLLAALRRPSLELEVVERLVQLEPERTENLERAAQLHLDAGRPELARARYLSAARVARTPLERERLLKRLHDTLYWVERETGERAARIVELRARVEGNPYDREAPELLLALLRTELRHAELGEVAELLLERRPDHAPWLLARCRARVRVEDVDGALADAERLVAAGWSWADLLQALSGELLRDVEGTVVRGLGARVEELLATLERTRFAQPTLSGGGGRASNADVLLAELLTGHVQVHGLDGPGVLELALALRSSLREPALEVQVLRAAVERRGPTVVLVHRLGLALHRTEDLAGARECGRHLIEFGAPDSMVQRYYQTCEIEQHLAADRAELQGTEPGDEAAGAGGR